MKLFWSLNEAIYHSEMEPELVVFAKEVGLSGQRHFLVSTNHEFWEIYKESPSKKHYEVVLPGKPCMLYMDLEYILDINQNKEGTAMTELLVEVVKRTVYLDFGLSTELEDVIILDSTNQKKFSRHIIFR